MPPAPAIQLTKLGSSKSLSSKIFRNKGVAQPAPTSAQSPPTIQLNQSAPSGLLKGVLNSTSGGQDTISSSLALAKDIREERNIGSTHTSIGISAEAIGIGADLIITGATVVNIITNYSELSKTNFLLESTDALSGSTGIAEKVVKIVAETTENLDLAVVGNALGAGAALASGSIEVGRAVLAGIDGNKAKHEENRKQLVGEAIVDGLIGAAKIAAGVVMLAAVANPIGPILLGAAAIASIGFAIYKSRVKAKYKNKADKAIEALAKNFNELTTKSGQDLETTIKEIFSNMSELEKAKEYLEKKGSERAKEIGTVFGTLKEAFKEPLQGDSFKESFKANIDNSLKDEDDIENLEKLEEVYQTTLRTLLLIKDGNNTDDLKTEVTTAEEKRKAKIKDIKKINEIEKIYTTKDEDITQDDLTKLTAIHTKSKGDDNYFSVTLVNKIDALKTKVDHKSTLIKNLDSFEEGIKTLNTGGIDACKIKIETAIAGLENGDPKINNKILADYKRRQKKYTDKNKDNTNLTTTLGEVLTKIKSLGLDNVVAQSTKIDTDLKTCETKVKSLKVKYLTEDNSNNYKNHEENYITKKKIIKKMQDHLEKLDSLTFLSELDATKISIVNLTADYGNNTLLTEIEKFINYNREIGQTLNKLPELENLKNQTKRRGIANNVRDQIKQILRGEINVLKNKITINADLTNTQKSALIKKVEKYNPK